MKEQSYMVNVSVSRQQLDHMCLITCIESFGSQLDVHECQQREAVSTQRV